MTTEELLFCLLRNEFKGENMPDNFRLTEEDTINLYRLSKRHDLAHLIGDVLFRLKLLPEGKVSDAFKQQILMSVLRYEQQNAEFKRICNIFKDAKIEFIPLKGAVIKEFYPQPWMRTSCDIDVLIHEEDMEKSIKILLENGFDTDGNMGYRHVSFFYGNFHLELHFNLCEGNKQMDEILQQVWHNVEKISEYEFRENSEFYVLYHIVHMARHFMSGGCGIRPFIDLWVLKGKHYYSEEKLWPLLETCNLVKFYRSVCILSDVWMNGQPHNNLTLKMGKYVLIGGVYGIQANANAVGVVKNKGKTKYLLKIAFLPYSAMCIIYPILKKYKILLPFCYIHRILIKLLGRDRKRTQHRINSTMLQSDENILSISTLLNDLELK